MGQLTFAELEYDRKKRRTWREIFLERMDQLIPWERLEDRIEPCYPKAGCGRQPYPLGVMLRVHCVQLFDNLSDPGMEDLLYEAESVRRFVGLQLTNALPDETTILNFRHLLEKHGWGEGLFEEINAHLAACGHCMKQETIVDATSGLTHGVATTAAHASSDLAHAHRLLHGGETAIWSDAPGGAPPTGIGRPCEDAREVQNLSACQSGASVPVREAALRIRQGALSGSDQEYAATGLAAGVH